MWQSSELIEKVNLMKSSNLKTKSPESGDKHYATRSSTIRLYSCNCSDTVYCCFDHDYSPIDSPQYNSCQKKARVEDVFENTGNKLPS